MQSWCAATTRSPMWGSRGNGFPKPPRSSTPRVAGSAQALSIFMCTAVVVVISWMAVWQQFTKAANHMPDMGRQPSSPLPAPAAPSRSTPCWMPVQRPRRTGQLSLDQQLAEHTFTAHSLQKQKLVATTNRAVEHLPRKNSNPTLNQGSLKSRPAPLNCQVPLPSTDTLAAKAA